MFDLFDSKIRFTLINPNDDNVSELQNSWNYERLCSVLYSKDFTVVPIKEYNDGIYKPVIVGISSAEDDDEIRKDVLQTLEYLDIGSAYIKYLGEESVFQIQKNGSETPITMGIYESYDNSKIYIYDGIYFSFKKNVRYFYPKNKEQLKSVGVIEFYNNEKWNQKEIINLDEEFPKMYELLIKYNKLRIPITE